jgi:hypothetical protein
MPGQQFLLAVADTAAGASACATWNPADKGTSCTLSGGNLVAAFTSDDMVRSTLGKSSGKWYWEVTVSSTGGFAVAGGVALASVPINNAPGEGVGNLAYYSHNGQLIENGSGYDTQATYTAGDVIGIALDMDALTVRYYKNNVAQGAAHTIAAGTYFATCGSASGAGTLTANFGATALAFTPPVGFIAGLCTLESETVTLLNAMTVQPDDARRTCIDTLIVALKAAGVWDKIGVLTLLAAHDEQASRLNWKTASIYWSVTGTPTFETDLGWTGVAATTHRLTGGELYTNSGGKFTYLNQHHAGWISNNATDALNNFVYTQDDTAQYWLEPRNASGDAQMEAADRQSSQIAVADSQGWYLATMDNSGGIERFYKNDTLLTSSFFGNQLGQSNRHLRALSSVFANVSPHRLAAVSAGEKLTSQNVADFYAAMLAYMQCVGAA